MFPCKIYLTLVVIHSVLHPSKLEIKDSSESRRSALYFNINTDGRLKTMIYDKLYNFNFPIVTYPLPILMEYLMGYKECALVIMSSQREGCYM